MEMTDPKIRRMRKPGEIPEGVLIQRILSGETDLYGILARRYDRHIYRSIRRLVRNHMDAEDIIQDTHLRILNYLHQFGGRSQFATWVSRVASNAAFTYLRQQRRLKRDDRCAAGATLTFTLQTPERWILDTELREILRNALAKLPPRYRAVFLLSEVGHMKTPEIARRLSIRRDNVRVKLYRSRRMLRDTIENSRE